LVLKSQGETHSRKVKELGVKKEKKKAYKRGGINFGGKWRGHRGGGEKK